jgi:hypothetical protein
VFCTGSTFSQTVSAKPARRRPRITADAPVTSEESGKLNRHLLEFAAQQRECHPLRFVADPDLQLEAAPILPGNVGR